MAMPRKVAEPTMPRARERAAPAYRWLAPAVASGRSAPAPAPWMVRRHQQLVERLGGAADERTHAEDGEGKP